jgi:hypothetical protein
MILGAAHLKDLDTSPRSQRAALLTFVSSRLVLLTLVSAVVRVSRLQSLGLDYKREQRAYKIANDLFSIMIIETGPPKALQLTDSDACGASSSALNASRAADARLAVSMLALT